MPAVTPPLRRTPQRIISLVPSPTEALFAFGPGGRIVGITDCCVGPQPQALSTEADRADFEGSAQVPAVRHGRIHVVDEGRPLVLVTLG